MTEIETYRARTAEMLADYDARLTAVIDADHEAALAEDAGRSNQHAEYRAYLCSMSDHGCECLALDFDRWHQVVIADQLVTDLQHVADDARDVVRRRQLDERYPVAFGYLKGAVLYRSQDEARATVKGIDQGLSARVPG